MYDLPICPECLQEKHGNCDGLAWCDAHDRIESCRCNHAGH